MTALREQMIDMVTNVSEDQIPHIILFIENMQRSASMDQNSSTKMSQQAYQNLQKYRRRGTKELDYKKEITEAIEEKYGAANVRLHNDVNLFTLSSSQSKNPFG